MKRPVSLPASLFAAAMVLTGCGGVQPGKAEFASICLDRYGNSQSKCDCFVGALEQNLPPEQFATLAKGAYDNRDFTAKDWLPVAVRNDARISSELREATSACLT